MYSLFFGTKLIGLTRQVNVAQCFSDVEKHSPRCAPEVGARLTCNRVVKLSNRGTGALARLGSCSPTVASHVQNWVLQALPKKNKGDCLVIVND